MHPNGLVFNMENLFRGGGTVTNVTGIMDYYSNLYRVQPTAGATYTNTNARTEAPVVAEGDLRISSFNVLAMGYQALVCRISSMPPFM